MRPLFKIEANDADVTAVIRKRFVSGMITDNEGLQSDTFEVTLDDRDNAIVIPDTGAELKVWLGYQASGLAYMGLYIFDEHDISGPPDQVVLKAKAAQVSNSETLKGMSASLKQQKTRSWSGQTLGSIVETIAGDAGYTPCVFADLGDELIEHVDQTEESDMHFLTRLALERNAVAKPAGGNLVLAPRGKSKSLTGRQLSAVTLDRSEITTWNLNTSEREAYRSVQTFWHNLQTGEKVAVTVGDGDPVKMLRGNFPTSEEAVRAAGADLDRIERGQAGLTLTLPGRSELAAEGAVFLTGFRKELLGEWSIKKATHPFSRSGFTTTLECEVPE